MSRQRLSYADLEQSTSTQNVSNSHLSSNATLSGEPPRKRMKTGPYIPSIDYMHNRHAPPNGNSYSYANQNAPPRNTARRGKPNRPGNPSGVHWTRHWDAQPEGEAGGLAYDQSQPSLAVNASSNNHFRTPHDGRFAQTANRQNPHARNAPNRPNSHVPFIGPVIPTSSHVANANTSGMNGSINPNAEASKKKKKRGKKGQNADKSNEVQENTGNINKKHNKPKPIVQFGHDWDDSALIDAWNAAEEQYREMNGGKKWQLESVKYSTLWHDTILSNDLDQHSTAETSVLDDEDDQIETADDHNEDPAAELVSEEYNAQEPYNRLDGNSGADTKGAVPENFMPKPSTSSAGPLSLMEEAFQKAKDASYALGYWTAIYNHNQRLYSASTNNSDMTTPAEVAEEEPVENSYEGEAADEDDDQRDDDDDELEEGEFEKVGGFAATQR